MLTLARTQRGGGRGSGPPGKSQNVGFLSNSGLDTLKNHKITKPASGHHWHAIETPFAFHWHADDGPLIVVFGSFLPNQIKKTLSKLVSL